MRTLSWREGQTPSGTEERAAKRARGQDLFSSLHLGGMDEDEEGSSPSHFGGMSPAMPSRGVSAAASAADAAGAGDEPPSAPQQQQQQEGDGEEPLGSGGGGYSSSSSSSSGESKDDE
mmetsp:Transcript_14471/g.34536  ORF Transcript_14471/g.34536 Transcript_14471/m.34536 type:complete len:118 (+) Transcript_14471:1094-1447(+)